MNWTIKIHKSDCEEEHTIPFVCNQDVYYAHKKNWLKKNSKWVLTKSRVIGVWATNIYGVTIMDRDHVFNNHICESEFKYLFTDRDEAIDFCLKKNERNKIKIYGE